MKKIKNITIASFFFIFFLICLFSFLTVALFSSILFDYRYVNTFFILAVLLAIYIFSGFSYQIISNLFPIPEGALEANSRAESFAQLGTLFSIFVFSIPLRSHLIIPPLTRLNYKLLGVKIGQNSYPSHADICEPYSFVTIGNNVIFGMGAIISPHLFEGGKFLNYKIIIGNNVTIGANSVIMPGVTIGNGALVAAGSVVKKHSNIPANEIWAGIPAKSISKSTAA